MNLWFKIFFRNAKKNWLNISINILGLTLGLAGLIVVLLYINDEESYNRWNPNKDNIYRASLLLPDGKIFVASADPEGNIYQENIPEVIDNTLVLPWYETGIIKNGDKKVYFDKIVIGENNFFDFFPFKFVKGNKDKLTQSKKNIAISQKTAIILFGKQDPINKTISFLDDELFIIAVYKTNNKSYYVPDVFIQNQEKRSEFFGNYSNALFLKLQKDAEIKKVQKNIDDILIKKLIEPAAKEEGITIEELIKKYGKLSTVIEPLGDIRLHNIANDGGPEGTGNYQLLLILLALSILLIIISCVNFVNLSIASAAQRAKEVGVKKNLGLSKMDLIKQYTLEVVLQCLVALLLALVLAELLLPSFNEFTQKEMSLLNIAILLKVGLITLIISFILGLIPALHLANFKAIEVLKGNFSRSNKGVFVRNAMLTLQIIISGFFIIGVLVIQNQIDYLSQKELGFSGEQIVSVTLNTKENRYKKYELMQTELVKNKNIQEVSSAFINPGFNNSGSTNLKYKEKSSNVLSNNIDFNYLDFLNIKLLKGRSFSPKFASDTISGIILNEEAAKRIGIYNNPIGKKVQIGWEIDGKKIDLEVLGMVKDYNIKGFETNIEPMFMLHWNSFGGWRKSQINKILFKINPENTSKTIAIIQNYWQENVEQGYPFTYDFLDKKFAETYEKYQKQQTLFSILSITVILIALLGLFALATLTIQQRLKEVAIRKTLGASVQEIMLQLIKNFLKIVVIASIILLPIAYYFMQNWLDNFKYKIDMPIIPYIITPIILAVLVFIVVGFKAFNATKVDLIKYLKFE